MGLLKGKKQTSFLLLISNELTLSPVGRVGDGLLKGKNKSLEPTALPQAYSFISPIRRVGEGLLKGKNKSLEPTALRKPIPFSPQ